MTDKYGLVITRVLGEITSFSIVELAAYPDNPKEYLRDSHEWYRTKMLDSFIHAIFPVSIRQSEPEARRRATEYAEFMNRQDAAMQLAITSITL